MFVFYLLVDICTFGSHYSTVLYNPAYIWPSIAESSTITKVKIVETIYILQQCSSYSLWVMKCILWIYQDIHRFITWLHCIWCRMKFQQNWAGKAASQALSVSGIVCQQTHLLVHINHSHQLYISECCHDHHHCVRHLLNSVLFPNINWRQVVFLTITSIQQSHRIYIVAEKVQCIVISVAYKFCWMP